MAARDGAPAPRGQLRCASPASGKATPHRCPAPLHPARPGPHDAVPCRHPSPARLVLYDATPPAVGYLCPQDSQVEAPSPGAAVSGAGAKAVEAVRARVCPRGLSPAGRGAPGRQGLCGFPPSAPLPLSLVGNRAPRWPTTATGDGRPSVRLRLPCAGFAAVLGDVAAPGPALATSTALESQAGGSQLRAGALRAAGHSLGLRAGVRPPAPREEPPEGAGEREPPHRTPGVGRRPFSGPPEGHGALSPVRAGRGPGTHQAHVVTAGGAGAGRSVRVQDPILKADSAGHAAVGRGAAAALPPSAETDPASRTFRASPP